MSTLTLQWEREAKASKAKEAKAKKAKNEETK